MDAALAAHTACVWEVLARKVGNVHPGAGFTNLTYLDLSGNQLTSLPPEIGTLTSLAALHLEGNPLTDMDPMITAQGSEAILNYLRDLFKLSLIRTSVVIKEFVN